MNEQKVRTSHRKIMILKDRMSHIPWAIFKTSLDELIYAAENLDSEKIQLLLDQIIPTYRPRTIGPHIEEPDNISPRSIKAEA